MGWFGGGSPAKISPVSETNVDPQPVQKYLEDLPPKFDDNQTVVPPKRTESDYNNAISQIKISDFTVERYLGMPCFREAMMMGFQAMAVLGGVTFFIRKDVKKAMNWGVIGFFSGSVIGWEQCRSIRRKSFEAMDKARHANQEKNAKKWNDKDNSDNDEKLEQFKKVQEYYNNKKQ